MCQYIKIQRMTACSLSLLWHFHRNFVLISKPHWLWSHTGSKDRQKGKQMLLLPAIPQLLKSWVIRQQVIKLEIKFQDFGSCLAEVTWISKMCFSKGAGGATSPSGSGISAFLISCTKYPGVRRTTESERKLHCLHFLECCRVDLQLLLMVLITLQHQGLAILFIHFSNNAHTEVFKTEVLKEWWG